MGYNVSISSIVRQYDGNFFFLHLDDVLTKIVHEFYAHLTSLNAAFIYVRGVSLFFDKDTINIQYVLFDIQDEHTQFAATITADGMNQVLQKLCVVGTKWIVSRQYCYIMEMETLKSKCRVWYHFLKTRLLPSTYNSIASKEQMLFLHSIMQGKKINVDPATTRKGTKEPKEEIEKTKSINIATDRKEEEEEANLTFAPPVDNTVVVPPFFIEPMTE
ncbi:hypothetical protein PVK06_043004 [Gossypium arboreum]|uniref:Putative plant transposon protein domain-containing protein n=1 Tax=Gossypium arboreum TaxID=29729 RepID=A0ABR0MMJ5_GOSAR|nr:hypothetical protein PVK06_043004 [Gossypium arboreum]